MRCAQGRGEDVADRAGRAAAPEGPPPRATSLTGEATTRERERPWGRSGWVTTLTTSKPSSSRARRLGTANSGVPKKTMRISASPAGAGLTSRMIALAVVLALELGRSAAGAAWGSGDRGRGCRRDGRSRAGWRGPGGRPPRGGRAGRPGRSPRGRPGPAGSRRRRSRESRGSPPRAVSRPEASMITGLIIANRCSSAVHHRHPARHAHLVGGEPDALGGVHRLEQIVDQPAHLLVHLGDLGAPCSRSTGEPSRWIGSTLIRAGAGATRVADLDDAGAVAPHGARAALDGDPVVLDVLDLARSGRPR